MKHLNTIVRAALLGLSLLSLPACEKQNEEPAIACYQFTADDMQWLNLKEGDKWVFETATGKQQSYVIQEVEKVLKRANSSSGNMGISLAEPSVKFYSDEATVELKRLDSLSFNTLRFVRTLPAGASYDYPPAGAGEFKFGGIWRTYTGDIFSGSNLGNLNTMPEQLQVPGSTTLAVKGKVYSNVIVIGSNNTNFLTTPQPYINTMYYARNEGIIRMISRSGEVWDRLP